MPQYYKLSTADSVNNFLAELEKRQDSGQHLWVCFEQPESPADPKPKDLRTNKQNSALHLWFRQCATVLNDNGISQHALLEELNNVESIEGQWTDSGFKEFVYKPVLEAMTGKQSTTQQSTIDPVAVVSAIIKWFAQSGLLGGLYLPPLPSRHNRGEQSE